VAVSAFLIPSFFRAQPEKAALRRVEAALAENFDGMYRFLRRLGVPDRDVEDALQEVSIVAMSKTSSIEEGRERSYLFGVAYRVGSNLRRRDHTRNETSDEALIELPDRSGDPSRLLDERRAVALLNRVLMSIPEELRAVFVLHEIEEHSMSDIATILSIPAGTVASRLRRARELFDAKVERSQA
jgi:RNA polymerase sigma-70 factor, ECF subfamily